MLVQKLQDRLNLVRWLGVGPHHLQIPRWKLKAELGTSKNDVRTEGRGEGCQKYKKIVDKQYINIADRGLKNHKNLLTSYMEALKASKNVRLQISRRRQQKDPRHQEIQKLVATKKMTLMITDGQLDRQYLVITGIRNPIRRIQTPATHKRSHQYLHLDQILK